MSIQSARVRDFQSVKDVSVEFDDFTVLVGPSNSGKSAFLRALRACIRNQFVPAMVREGTSKAVIDVDFTETTVGIERGKSLSTYHLGKGDAVFTKSAKTVPTEVLNAIRMPLVAEVDPSFRTQFDKPFLLAETGSTAASVVGSLTNVSMLHAAVRETNRRRQEAASTLKVRQGDVERLKGQIESFRSLPERKARLDSAEQSLESLRSLEQRLTKVQTAYQRVVESEQALVALHAEQAKQPTDVSLQFVELARLVNRQRRIQNQVNQIRTLATEVRRLKTQSADLYRQAGELTEEHDQFLQSLGTCPVCGKTTKDA